VTDLLKKKKKDEKPDWMKKDRGSNQNPKSQTPSGEKAAKPAKTDLDSKSVPPPKTKPALDGKKATSTAVFDKFGSNEKGGQPTESRRRLLAKTVALDKASSDFINNLISSQKTWDL